MTRVLLFATAITGRVSRAVGKVRGLIGAALLAAGAAAIGGWPVGLLVFGGFLVVDAAL